MNIATITSRDVRREDIDRCIEIYLANVFEKVSFEHDLRRHIELSLERSSGFTKPEFVVVEDGGQVIGFACYSLLTFDSGGYGFSWCNVHPDHRGKGVGGLLVQARIDRVKFMYGEFILSSQREEHKWHLERFGFKKIGTSGSYETERFALMQLIL